VSRKDPPAFRQAGSDNKSIIAASPHNKTRLKAVLVAGIAPLVKDDSKMTYDNE